MRQWLIIATGPTADIHLRRAVLRCTLYDKDELANLNSAQREALKTMLKALIRVRQDLKL